MRRPVLVLAALIGLGGCSLFSSGEDTPAVNRCPSPGIINGLASSDHFREGAPQTPENLLYSVGLMNIEGGCQPEGDDLVVFSKRFQRCLASAF